MQARAAESLAAKANHHGLMARFRPPSQGSSMQMQILQKQCRKPDLFLVGAPKSGTTAMAKYLGAHPEIYMAQKEMHCFGDDLHFGPRFYRRDRQAYLGQFQGCNGQRHAGEASVWYLFSRHAASEIKDFNPDANIIIMLREPVELLYSMYYQFRFDANEHLPSFAEALAAETDRQAGRRMTRRTYFAQGLVYHEIVHFAEQVERYFDAFGRERVHVIIYDDFAADPAAAYHGALEFLGVDSNCAPPEFRVVNGNKNVKSRLLQAVLSDPLVRSTAFRLGRRLPRPMFAALARAERLLWGVNARPARRPALGPGLKSRLRRELAPEVERLSELLGRDLTCWTREEAPGESIGGAV